MKHHDPHCPAVKPHTSSLCQHETTTTCGVCVHECLCDLLAVVRAEEALKHINRNIETLEKLINRSHHLPDRANRRNTHRTRNGKTVRARCSNRQPHKCRTRQPRRALLNNKRPHPLTRWREFTTHAGTTQKPCERNTHGTPT